MWEYVCDMGATTKEIQQIERKRIFNMGVVDVVDSSLVNHRQPN